MYIYIYIFCSIVDKSVLRIRHHFILMSYILVSETLVQYPDLESRWGVIEGLELKED